ncbi:hypothetical protein NDU88_005898 [Pleurodeles waltl]|uniref:Uncharacterized protein n=1 Tax=Pleurodeles waltl TaxID=8319 RepID=A0AAV7VN11_PLEWA|nr:hypothetical protein NDU88_005898 [Pleurodeles waltl]
MGSAKVWVVPSMAMIDFWDRGPDVFGRTIPHSHLLQCPRGMCVRAPRPDVKHLMSQVSGPVDSIPSVEAAWEWLESTGRISGRELEKNLAAPRSRRIRAKRARRTHDVTPERVKHVPDPEQIIQELREALQAINSPSTASATGTEALQPKSEELVTPDHLSETDSPMHLGVTPHTAEELF